MGSSLLLTIGSLVMLGIFMLSANGLISGNIHTAEENEYYLTALSLAQSVIDEAKTKSFDEATVAGVIASPPSLCPPAYLGPESSEILAGPDTAVAGVYLSQSRFNDIDDYHGYVRLVNTARADGYTVTGTVEYANPLWPDSGSAVATFCKKMTVTITSPYLPGPVSLQYAFVY